MYIGRNVCTLKSCPILMKPEFSRQIFEKYSNIKFHEKFFQWEPGCSMRTDGRTDMNLRGAFRNFANAPKKTSSRTCSVCVCGGFGSGFRGFQLVFGTPCIIVCLVIVREAAHLRK